MTNKNWTQSHENWYTYYSILEHSTSRLTNNFFVDGSSLLNENTLFHLCSTETFRSELIYAFVKILFHFRENIRRIDLVFAKYIVQQIFSQKSAKICIANVSQKCHSCFINWQKTLVLLLQIWTKINIWLLLRKLSRIFFPGFRFSFSILVVNLEKIYLRESFCENSKQFFFRFNPSLSPLYFSSAYSEPVFLNVYGAQESIPRNEFRQPM